MNAAPVNKSPDVDAELSDANRTWIDKIRAMLSGFQSKSEFGGIEIEIKRGQVTLVRTRQVYNDPTDS